MTAASAIEGNTHIVPMPRWGSVIGVARFALAILTLIFAAVAVSIWGDGNTAFGFTLFTASATLIIFGYYFVALSRKPELYNRWAILGCEVFGIVFWAVSFALCARWTSAHNQSNYWYGDDRTSYGFWHAPYTPADVGLQERALQKASDGTSTRYHASVALAGTAAGLGALEFLLFSVTLLIFSINLHKHRKEGNPSIFGGAPTTLVTEAAGSGNAEKDTAAEEDKPAVVKKDSSAVV